MKKVVVAGGLASFLAVSACSDEGNNDGQSNTELEEETAAEELEPIDVEETEEGTFEVYKQTDGESVEAGPVHLEIEQALVGTAQLDGYIAAFTSEEQIDYIQLDVNVENTSSEDVHFAFGHAKMTTNTGEEVEVPNIVLSDESDHELQGNDSQSGSFIYPLEESTVADIQELEFVFTGPGESADSELLAEDVHVKVEFEG
ncbi:hypothetical protein [Shouchella patagoniensis]|uniref:hypothetical protein n=1 Tax=Shouchella patagoniensis TaxID=228576 RepID=UPI0009959384|nr:hypothetical protein [Shouchella patagoniensis]